MSSFWALGESPTPGPARGGPRERRWAERHSRLLAPMTSIAATGWSSPPGRRPVTVASGRERLHGEGRFARDNKEHLDAALARRRTPCRRTVAAPGRRRERAFRDLVERFRTSIAPESGGRALPEAASIWCWAAHRRRRPSGPSRIRKPISGGCTDHLSLGVDHQDDDRDRDHAVARPPGLLKLDDPIVRHVPELARVHNRFGDTGAITLRHLMSHSAGFRSGTWPWREQEWQPFEPGSWAQLEAMLPYTEVQFRAGERFSYSNPGIVYLGQVIERLSGEDFEVYVDKNILKPLGMHSSYFDRTPPTSSLPLPQLPFRQGSESPPPSTSTPASPSRTEA